MCKPRNYEAEFAVKLRHVIRGAFSSSAVGGIIDAIRERDIARDAGLAEWLAKIGPVYDIELYRDRLAEFREREERR